MKLNDLILSIETSSETCGIALSSAGKLICEYSFYGQNVHDKLLSKYLIRLLADCNISINDINAVALSCGPGSFTGIRIGFAFVKGLLFGTEVKFIAVPTMESLYSATLEFALSMQSNIIATYIKSHKDLFFYQEYDLNLKTNTEIEIIKEEKLKNNLAKPLVYSGNYYIDFEQNKTLSGLLRLSPRFVAKRAYEKYLVNDFEDIESYSPLYQLDFTPKNKETN